MEAGAILHEAANPMRLDGTNSMDSTLSSIKTEKLWVPDFASEWMYCMVLPAESMNDGTYDSYTGKMQTYGLEVFSYTTKEELIVVLIRPTDEVVRAFADEVNFKMKTNPVVLKRTMETGDEELQIAPVEIRHDPEVASYLPYEMIYFPYSTQVPDEIYKCTD